MTQENIASADPGIEVKKEESTDSRLLLLKEYTAKFRRLAKQAKVRWERPSGKPTRPEQNVEYRVLTDLLRRLKAPALEFARHVSQHIQHGDLDLPERLEFQLRLAEFEHAIQAAEWMINNTRP